MKEKKELWRARMSYKSEKDGTTSWHWFVSLDGDLFYEVDTKVVPEHFEEMDRKFNGDKIICGFHIRHLQQMGATFQRVI